MMTGIVQDQNLEKQIGKQMGCMAGFLNIFDRHQILTGKRLYATKRLPSTPAVESSPESEKAMGSPAMSRELEKQQQSRSLPSPDRLKQYPVKDLRSPVSETATQAENLTKSSLPLPVFELKEGTKSLWKFSREAPRLSLDSRAVVDAKGSLKPREIRTNAAILSANRCENTEDGADDIENQRRSTSVIARLMGLETLPSSDPESAKLRRSASESRVHRDQYRFIDRINFQLQQSQQQQHNLHSNIASNVIRNNNNINKAVKEDYRSSLGRAVDPREYPIRSARAEPANALHRGIAQRKSFLDSAIIFTEPKQTVCIYGEIEKRLKMRGIDEPSKDLETLKQLLDALQLKGLLHSNKPPSQIKNRNFVYERSFPHSESPIVVMRPARSPVQVNRTGRIGNVSPPSGFRPKSGARLNMNLSGDASPAEIPRRDRPQIDRNARSQTRGRNAISPTRSESSVKSPSRRVNKSIEQRRVSPVPSPKVGLRRNGPDQTSNPSPRNRKPKAEIYHKEEKGFIPAEDELSTVSDSSISTSSQTDTERPKLEGFKEGRSLLERCDKLLHSIAEMTATELQPSPVSVLDSSFYKEESSPSPVMKRSIDFKEQPIESEDDMWSSAISSVESKSEDKSDDCDYLYISDILRASSYLHDHSDIFLLLEKQQHLKGKDTSKVSRLQRKLIFDTINEILNRKRQLPPWKAVSWTNSSTGQTSLQQIWSEFQKIRERDASEDLFEVICGVLRKDLAGDGFNGWENCPIQMSKAVLDIERLIFKDLIGEIIRDLAAFSGKCNNVPVLRRKLVF